LEKEVTNSSKVITPVAVLFALAVPAFAQNAAIDINGDGMYSYAELRAALPDISEDTFGILDTSGDGLLSADEITAGTAAGLLPS
jgi:hypothetical protein